MKYMKMGSVLVNLENKEIRCIERCQNEFSGKTEYGIKIIYGYWVVEESYSSHEDEYGTQVNADTYYFKIREEREEKFKEILKYRSEK